MPKGASSKNKALHRKKRYIILLFIFIPVIFSSITLNVKDFGAKGNGSTDDTAAFQRCIDALKSKGGGTMTVSKGNYPITFLKFFGKEYSNITITGENANIFQRISGSRKATENNRFQTFAQRHAADGCFVFDAQVSKQKDDTHSIKNIKISGLNFISEVKKYGFDELLHQISAHGVSDFIVENCTFTGFLGDGIAINGGTDFSRFHDAYNKEVIIRNCRFDGVNKNNRQGISIYYSDGFTIDRCSFINTTRDDMPGAIDIEPDRGMNVVRNGVISNCHFENIGGMGAICINLKAGTAENQFSNQGYLIENCIFEKVNSPLMVKGIISQNQDREINDHKIIFSNSSVKDAKTVFRFVNADHLLLKNLIFEKIMFPMNSPVTAGECENITLYNCSFSDIASTSQFIFYGNVKNLRFQNCIFKGKKSEQIMFSKMTDTDKLRNINTYIFWLVHYKLYILILLIALIIGLNMVTYTRKRSIKKLK